MNETKRKRLEKRIQRLIAELSIKGLKDPNIGFVTFTSCELSTDGAHAKVYVSIFEEEQARKQTMQALIRAAGFIRHRLGKVLAIKVIPQIHFVEDESLLKA
ncbi:MAG: 30S ribosome-binding factor RbfA, partial [Leptospirales bacterium]